MSKKISAAFTSAVILSLFAMVIDASDNYTVNHGANTNITAHTECRKVTNNSATGASVYVPTQTSPEWQSFRTSPPAGVTLDDCVIDVAVTAGTNHNLCTLAGNPTTAGNYTFTIPSGAIIYSGSTGSPALTTGTCWVSGSTITIVNNGRIYGKGGNGSAGATTPGTAGAGGNAMSLSYPVSIDNTNGYIFGGGGGGGGGSRGYNAYAAAGGGGGGASGPSASSGGAGQNTLMEDGSAGASGTTSGGGAGGAGGTYGQHTGGRGGSGGTWGAAGARGAEGTTHSTMVYDPAPGGAGGAAGKAIDTNGHAVTWIAGNNTTRVKGAVSN
jgi:hypothetical protein